MILATLSILLSVAWPTAAASAGVQTPRPGEPDLDTLEALHASRDFFSLRDHLRALEPPQSTVPAVRLLEAALQQAFNDLAGAGRTIDELLTADQLDPELSVRLRALQLTNSLRLHRYDEALRAARAFLASPASSSDPALAEEVRGKLPLLEALADAPPQEAEIRAPSRLALGNDRRLPLEIENRKYKFALDTGANLSVIQRSEAEKLDLRIRAADLLVSTSTARKVSADVAVARQVKIGNVHYRNVVFLVFPDELLSFPNGRSIPGLVGFPLVEAMGEVRFRLDNVIEIPKDPPKRTQENLALDGLDPLIRIRYRKDQLLCRLDTGAGQTVFYEPFFQRYRPQIESVGNAITARAGGVGGFAEIPAYRLPKMAITVAAAGVTLRLVEVYTRPIRSPEENYLYCNVGLDVLDRFRSYTINFRDMALVLR